MSSRKRPIPQKPKPKTASRRKLTHQSDSGLVNLTIVHEADGTVLLTLKSPSDSGRSNSLCLSSDPTLLAKGLFFRAEQPPVVVPIEDSPESALRVTSAGHFTPPVFYAGNHDFPMWVQAGQGFLCTADDEEGAAQLLQSRLSSFCAESYDMMQRASNNIAQITINDFSKKTWDLELKMDGPEGMTF